MLAMTRIKKLMIVLCAISVAISLSGCAVLSNASVSNSEDEQVPLANAADMEITNAPVQEHNSNDKLPTNEPIKEGSPDSTMPIMEREAASGETMSEPKDRMFKIRAPKKQVIVSEDETKIIEKIYVNHLLAGKIYEYTFSTQEDFAKILLWYNSLELKLATFTDGEQKPNEKNGANETYVITYTDGTEKEFIYYDDYIWMIEDDIWYVIEN